MADDKIDRAIVTLCRDYPRQTFSDNGRDFIHTSTCSTAPMVTRRFGRLETRDLMYADMRFYYDTLRVAGFKRNETFAFIGERYGRGKSTIEEALKLYPPLFPKSE